MNPAVETAFITAAKAVAENVEEDLLALCGAVLPPKAVRAPVEAGQKPPRQAPSRFTEWNNNASFESEGYVALVTHSTCETCGHCTKLLQGVFHSERHRPSGTRRLQLLGKGAQWPVNEEFPTEVTQAFTLYCGECITGLGFGRIVEEDEKRPYTLIGG